MRHALLQGMFLALIWLNSAPSFADTIVSTLPVNNVGGGFWFGTSPADLGGDTYIVAQEFTTYREYSNITGEALLHTLQGPDIQFPTVSYSLAADLNGVPGSVLATSSFTLTGFTATLYSLTFPSVVLQDATNYWLVASTNAIGSAGRAGLPAWINSQTSYAGAQTNLNLNGIWAEFIPGQATAFALYGQEIGNPIDNGNFSAIVFTPPLSVPEPSTFLLLVCGLLALAVWRIRRPSERVWVHRSPA